MYAMNWLQNLNERYASPESFCPDQICLCELLLQKVRWKKMDTVLVEPLTMNFGFGLPK